MVHASSSPIPEPGSTATVRQAKSTAMGSLYAVVQEGNKFDTSDLKDMWALHVMDIKEAVGYMRDSIRKQMVWDKNAFKLDESKRTILLSPKIREGEEAPAACRRAFSNHCHLNQGRLSNCFDKWLTKPKEDRDFHPIHNTDSRWQDLSIPLPARGIFGVITIGVHLNMYTVKTVNGREEVDRIWVSQRATGDMMSYSGMLDQVVAGGMDTTDRIQGLLAPSVTLKREAGEEADILLDLQTKTMSVRIGWKRKSIGIIEEAPHITFYDCKGIQAGRGSEGHLEPGVRFVYDLKLTDPGFQPTKAERNIEKFEAFSVDQVLKQLRDKRWKPNCGLVMLGFLLRKGLVTPADDERFELMGTGLRRQLPFRYSQEGFPFLAR
ncbi:Fc.00g063310.m01.CDS01 [Cosmosporella sp. VM-42]